MFLLHPMFPKRPLENGIALLQIVLQILDTTDLNLTILYFYTLTTDPLLLSF